jgi:putative hydrolase of the HAD superfamily
MPSAPIKVLVFDLDDTLVVEKESAAAAFRATCQLAAERVRLDPAALHASVRQSCRELWHHHNPARAYAVAVGISSWEALWSRFAGDHPDLALLRAWAATYRRTAWLNALQTQGIDDPDLAAELAEAYPKNRRRRHIVYDDVRPALETWRPRCRLALLTNGASDLQREKLSGAKLAGYFEEVLVAGDIGCAKPHPEMFQTLLARLGVHPAEALMFGDSQSKDIQGAQAVGMRTVWVNRAATARRDGVRPDLEVTTLADGVEWIATNALGR